MGSGGVLQAPSAGPGEVLAKPGRQTYFGALSAYIRTFLTA